MKSFLSVGIYLCKVFAVVVVLAFLGGLVYSYSIKPNQKPIDFPYHPTETSSASPITTRAVSKGSAISLSCRDGMVLAYCQVYWSDGSYRPLPMGIGPRRGGVSDAIIYYDLQWNPTCILLYADGSILTSYDTNNCN